MVSMIERSELLIGISFVPLLSTLNHWPHSFVDMASRSIGRMSETTLVPYPDNSILVISMIKIAPLC